ncbi:MAG: HIT family protein [Acholeplasmataceae bacterium]
MATIFERIIAREIPAHVVYEDEKVIAFLDISQATKGHTLLVSKTPYRNILDMPDDEAGSVFAVASRLSKVLKEVFRADGLNVITNAEERAGQTVFHFHIHLIPRYTDDDMTIRFPNHADRLSEADYEERAKAIRAALS